MAYAEQDGRYNPTLHLGYRHHAKLCFGAVDIGFANSYNACPFYGVYVLDEPAAYGRFSCAHARDNRLFFPVSQKNRRRLSRM